MSQLHRFLVLFLSLLQAITALFAVRGGITPIREENAAMTLLNREQTTLAATAEYAYRVKNAAQGTYTDAARSAYRMVNAEAALTHRLTGASKTAAHRDPDRRRVDALWNCLRPRLRRLRRAAGFRRRLRVFLYRSHGRAGAHLPRFTGELRPPS